MISCDEAKKLLDEKIRQIRPSESAGQTISLAEALGRILSQPVTAPVAVPLFDNSAMDGFALRSSETITASTQSPLTLAVADETKAGDPPTALKAAQTAVRIMTGAAIPLGADAVIRKEDVSEEQNFIRIMRPVEPGENIRQKGEDFNVGDPALPPGVRISPGVVGLLASLGVRNVTVRPRPRVSVLATGHELVSSIDALKPGKILESNAVFLKSALAEAGLSAFRLSVADDNPQILRQRLVGALEDSDIIIVTGGVSVGDHDHTRPILDQLGVTTLFWEVAQKPGKPLYAGTLGEKLIFGLPGNPYAVFVCFYLYVRPVLLQWMGQPQTELPRARARLTRPFSKKDNRTHFLKGKTETADGTLTVTPLKGQGSHLMGALATANCLIRIPPHRNKIEAGEETEVIFL